MSLIQQESGVAPLKKNRSAKASKRPSGLPKSRSQPAQVAPAPAEPAPGESLHDARDYGLDVWQRTVLFWDALRQRADNMLEHERAGLPPLLDFKYETVLDARRFEQPANYALLRITEVGEDCWEDCVDPDKPPVIVVDPRAGHGTGIGARAAWRRWVVRHHRRLTDRHLSTVHPDPIAVLYIEHKCFEHRTQCCTEDICDQKP